MVERYTSVLRVRNSAYAHVNSENTVMRCDQISVAKTRAVLIAVGVMLCSLESRSIQGSYL